MQSIRLRHALLVALTVACAGCKSAGASSGPNPNMEALNAHYGLSITDRRADYTPLFLYYPDAPKPASSATPNAAGATAQRLGQPRTSQA